MVATVALGQGAQAKVAQQMESLGTNLLIVSPGSASRRTAPPRGAGAGRPSPLDDVAALERELPRSVAAVAPVNRTGAQVVYGDHNWSTAGQGTTAAYLDGAELASPRASFFGRDEDAPPPRSASSARRWWTSSSAQTRRSSASRSASSTCPAR